MITAMLSKLLLLVFARGIHPEDDSADAEDESESRQYVGPRGPHDELPARDFTIHTVEAFYGLGNP